MKQFKQITLYLMKNSVTIKVVLKLMEMEVVEEVTVKVMLEVLVLVVSVEMI